MAISHMNTHDPQVPTDVATKCGFEMRDRSHGECHSKEALLEQTIQRDD